MARFDTSTSRTSTFGSYVMWRLIATPPRWIERDHDALMGQFFVDHTQQVPLIKRRLRHEPTPPSAEHVFRFTDGVQHSLFCNGKPVVSQKRKLGSRIARQTNGLFHNRSLAQRHRRIKEHYSWYSSRHQSGGWWRAV